MVHTLQPGARTLNVFFFTFKGQTVLWPLQQIGFQIAKKCFSRYSASCFVASCAGWLHGNSVTVDKEKQKYMHIYMIKKQKYMYAFELLYPVVTVSIVHDNHLFTQNIQHIKAFF